VAHKSPNEYLATAQKQTQNGNTKSATAQKNNTPINKYSNAKTYIQNKNKTASTNTPITKTESQNTPILNK